MKCCRIFIFLIVVVSLALLLAGCGNRETSEEAKSYDTFEDTAAVEENTVNERKDTAAAIENTADKPDNISADSAEKSETAEEGHLEEKVIEHVNAKAAVAYYKDCYVENRYLLIEKDCLTSMFISDDFVKTESIPFENLVRMDINYVGEQGFIDITDKAGGSLSFVFDLETTDAAKRIIDEYME